MPAPPLYHRVGETDGTPNAMPHSGPLREGFTTGTATTAAACAALDLLLGGVFSPVRFVPLPPPLSISTRLSVPVESVHRLGLNVAQASVIKDGGDDPDVTHGARIIAYVELLPASLLQTDPDRHASVYREPPRILTTKEPDQPGKTLPPPRSVFLPGSPPIELRAGQGIGRVTLPGLPVAVGDPAINPAPRRQIGAGLTEISTLYAYTGRLRVTVSIPDGEELAKKTLNPRLGIMGGLSILGTHGTVRPYSHAAWTASIEEGLSVARAIGCDCAVLSTGRRSERLLQALYPELPPPAFVQAADFAAFSLETAARFGFSRLTWGCFFGKLVKLAQGLPYTHAHDAPLDLKALAAWCQEAGMGAEDVAPIPTCSTAGQALEIILLHPRAPSVLHALAERGRAAAEHFACPHGHGPSVTLHLFHINGKELVRT